VTTKKKKKKTNSVLKWGPISRVSEDGGPK